MEGSGEIGVGEEVCREKCCLGMKYPVLPRVRIVCAFWGASTGIALGGRGRIGGTEQFCDGVSGPGDGDRRCGARCDAGPGDLSVDGVAACGWGEVGVEVGERCAGGELAVGAAGDADSVGAGGACGRGRRYEVGIARDPEWIVRVGGIWTGFSVES